MVINEALLAALDSPDPAVRGIAIRRRGMDDEIKQLDAFLGEYARLKQVLPPAASEASAAIPAAVKEYRRSESVQTGFSEEIRELLKAQAGQMQFRDLHAAYSRTHGKSVTLRRKILRRPGEFEVTDDDVVRIRHANGSVVA